MEHDTIKVILFILIILSSPILVIGRTEDKTPSTYITYVDDGLGFYKVRDVTDPNHTFDYNNRTLIINQGDTVIWENDAEKSTFTVLSEQNLWDSKVGYLRSGSKINYKFVEAGEYVIYIKEYTSKRQTIVVNGMGIPTPTITIPKITPTINQTAIVNTTMPTQTRHLNTSKNDSSNPVDVKVPQFDIPGIKLPIKMSARMMASIIVALLSMIITYLVGRNRK